MQSRTEFLEQQLRALLASGAREKLDALPDAIHSGLAREGSHGLLFANQDIAALIVRLNELVEIAPAPPTGNGSGPRPLIREDLRLICFDHVVG